MDPDQPMTERAGGADEPLFGLAVPAEARAETLRRYLQEAAIDIPDPFTGWVEHVYCG